MLLLNTVSSHNPSFPNIETEVDLNQTHSQTEKNICEYHPPGNTLQDYIPLVKGNDGKFYPKNPHNNYVSRLSEGFVDTLVAAPWVIYSVLARIKQARV